MAVQKKTLKKTTKTVVKKSSTGTKRVKKNAVAKKKAPVKKKPAVDKKKMPAKKIVTAKKKTQIKKKPAVAKKSAPVKKKMSVKKTVTAKKKTPVKKKTATTKKELQKKKGAGKPTTSENKAKKSTLELIKAIKARDIETHKNDTANAASGTKKTRAAAKAQAKAKPVKRKPLPIVPPMQKAIEIIVPSSKDSKKKRRISFKKKDLKIFRGELLLMREHFTGQTDSMKHDALQRDDEVNPEEDGTDAFMRLQALNQMNDQQHIVADIDEALTSIEKGTYGACEMCDCLISKLRLKARPFAKFCVKCKSNMERSNRFKKPR